MANNNELFASKILKYDSMTPRTLMSIDSVRVKKIEGIESVRVKDKMEFVRVNKKDEDMKRLTWSSQDRIWDEDHFHARFYGSVIVTDCCGDHVVYHSINDCGNGKLSEYIKNMIVPSPRVYGHRKVIISVNLWVQWRDDKTLISKEIANGEIVWDPTTQDHSSYDKPLQLDVLGKHGSVTLGYTVIRKAVRATIQVVVLTPESPEAEIYGTVKACRFLQGGSSTTHMLFHYPMVRPQQLCWSRSLFGSVPVILVPALSSLTIEVDLWGYDKSSILWHRLPADSVFRVGGGYPKSIVECSLPFTPILGTQTKNITGNHGGQVQVSITFE